MRRTAVILVLALAAVTGCSDKPGAKPEARETGDARPSSSPTPVVAPTIDAAVQLAELAARGQAASYSAAYNVTGSPAGTATIQRTPGSYRFELATGSGRSAQRALLIRTPKGTVSCTVIPRPLTCLRVAGPGEPIPAVFDAGLQKVFGDYLVELATPSSRYAVQPAVSGAGGGQCFDVQPGAQPPARGTGVAAGTYCFTPEGVPSRVSYASGDLVLVKVYPAPPATAFFPPASPQPVPSS